MHLCQALGWHTEDDNRSGNAASPSPGPRRGEASTPTSRPVPVHETPIKQVAATGAKKRTLDDMWEPSKVKRLQAFQSRAWAAAGWSAASADLPEVRQWMEELASTKLKSACALSAKQIYSFERLREIEKLKAEPDASSLEEWKKAHMDGKEGVMMTDGGTIQNLKWRNYLWQGQDDAIVFISANNLGYVKPYGILDQKSLVSVSWFCNVCRRIGGSVGKDWGDSIVGRKM